MGSMRYVELARTFEELDSTTSRLKKTEILANFLKSLPIDVAQPSLLLLQGRVFPEWDSRRVGLAAKLVLKGLSRASGFSEGDVFKEFKKVGDIGLAAQAVTEKKRQQTLFSSPLELDDVFTSLQKLASMQGTGSQDIKLAELSKLLTSASPIEAKFIVRTVIEDLRVGIATGTIRDALAFAFFTDSFSYNLDTKKMDFETEYDIDLIKSKIKRALDLTADFSAVFEHLRDKKSLDDIRLRVGTPCKVMLARKEGDFDSAFGRTGIPARLEYKYDGFRLQIHKKGDEVFLFTRRLEEVTSQFPEIHEFVKNNVKATNAIMDCEAVGYDPRTEKYKPFQHISKRIRRKYDIEVLAKELPVELNIFDVLLLEDNVLLELPLKERLPILESIISPVPRKIVLAKGCDVNSVEKGVAFYEESLAAGNEGVMIKSYEGKYEPGGRVTAWIKMKPIMDELDLVVVGAEWGEGKRSAWMTSFTLACRNEDGELLEIGRVGTGLKELEDGDSVTFKQVTDLLEPLIISEKGKEVRVKPEVVLMLAYEEIQKSPTYSSGYALRFPRVLRLRPDRSVEDIALYEDILDLYDSQ